ncbi:MAG: exo-alpha-sialidase [Caldilineaceae bacterium]|nr:exo-alpha-sialidase [Caldilineaceae bacterium]
MSQFLHVFPVNTIHFPAWRWLLGLCGALLFSLGACHGAPIVRAQAELPIIDYTQNIKAMGYTDSRKIVRDSQGQLYVAYRKKYKLHRVTAYHIFVAKSADNGAHWTVVNAGRPIESVGDFNQRVAAIGIDSQDRLHVVWYGADASTLAEEENQIKYVRSTDGGNSWSAWRNLSVVPGYQNQDLWQEHPTLFIDRTDQLYVVWEGKDGWYTKTAQIKFSRSNDNGQTWSDWINVAPANHSHSRPTLVTTGDTLYLLAYGSVQGRQQILYTSSTTGGKYWARWRSLAASPQDQRHVAAAIDADGTVHIVWRQLPMWATTPQDTNAQIYYTTLAAAPWQSPVRIAPQLGVAQTYPSIAIDQTHAVWITWQETTDPYGFPQDAPTTGSLAYIVKSAAGWSDPVRSAPGANQLYPSLRRDLTQSPNQIDVVWLEAQPTTHPIRFAQLVRPTVFKPTPLAGEGQPMSIFLMSYLAWPTNLWQAVPTLTTLLQPLSQHGSDLRALLILLTVVSVYVVTKFLLQRWLTVGVR